MIREGQFVERFHIPFRVSRRGVGVALFIAGIPLAIIAANNPGLQAALASSSDPIVPTKVSEGTPIPNPTKPAVVAYHITKDPRYCENSTNRQYKQTQAPETGCPTPTAIPVATLERKSEANDPTSWGLEPVTDEESTATPIPTIGLSPQPGVFQSPMPTPTINCYGFSEGDGYKEQCFNDQGIGK